MSATYNWAYKPGVANKYGLTVPSTADNVRPSGWVYVASYGNDSTGNGSRQYPFRTIAKSLTVAANSTTFVLGSGVYRETASNSFLNLSFVGDGDVTIDFSAFVGVVWSNFANSNFNFYNLKFIGNGYPILNYNYASGLSSIDCVFNYTAPVSCSNNQLFRTSVGYIKNCTIMNYARRFSFGDQTVPASSNTTGNCSNFSNITLYNCNDFVFSVGNYNNIIISNSNVSFSNSFSSGYLPVIGSVLFFQCNFKTTYAVGDNSGAGTVGGALYPSTPTGYTYYSSFTSLLSYYTALFPTITSPLVRCAIADPAFNNPSIGDFSLSFNSPAKNMSYQGACIGASSVANQLKISATEASGNFDFSTAVNLTINDNSLTITDTTQNSQIDTKLIANPTGRELSKLSVLGFTADRNGQYLSSFADLATTTKSPADTLSVPTPYLVENGAITYNGGVYQPGDRLTTVTGQTAFTTTSGGTLREIVQAPARHTIMARFSDGAGTVTAGTALTAGYWYYVESGSVTYDSVTYNAGSSFKAVDTNSFSGTGVVTLALSTESFQHYEPGIQPTSNNTGDTRTGSIIRGNGDPNYVRGGLYVKEFPINTRFFQLRFILQVNNLKL